MWTLCLKLFDTHSQNFVWSLLTTLFCIIIKSNRRFWRSQINFCFMSAIKVKCQRASRKHIGTRYWHDIPGMITSITPSVNTIYVCTLTLCGPSLLHQQDIRITHSSVNTHFILSSLTQVFVMENDKHYLYVRGEV